MNGHGMHRGGHMGGMGRRIHGPMHGPMHHRPMMFRGFGWFSPIFMLLLSLLFMLMSGVRGIH